MGLCQVFKIDTIPTRYFEVESAALQQDDVSTTVALYMLEAYTCSTYILSVRLSMLLCTYFSVEQLLFQLTILDNCLSLGTGVGSTVRTTEQSCAALGCIHCAWWNWVDGVEIVLSRTSHVSRFNPSPSSLSSSSSSSSPPSPALHLLN